MRGGYKHQGYGVAVEYAGASATDDRWPVFQQMLAKTTREPAPFEAIVVHNYCRANPLKAVSVGAQALYIELTNKK